MAKIDITKTELVWPGKYNDDGTRKEVPRVSLPFQVIETVNESRATRETQQTKTMSLFDVYQGEEGDTFDEGWKNKLIWGDNLLVMSSLLKDFAGKIDLIYIDPPFATGTDFTYKAKLGDGQNEVIKQQSVIEEKAYRDTWGFNGEKYTKWIYQRLVLCRELLATNGSFFIHLDPTMVHSVKVILDEIFGQSGEKANYPGFRNEIVWCYSGGGVPRREFPRKHQVILWYSKGTSWTFNREYKPYKENTQGVGIHSTLGPGGKIDLARGTPVTDWWTDINSVTGWHPERVEIGYPTQKPKALLERVIRTCSNPGDLVADFFCGSGTTLAAAEDLQRRWIGCDLGRWGIHITRKRLLGIDNCRPFEVLNLGKYERQYWQGVTFGEKRNNTINEQAFYEYLAFVLKLYGAQPLPGMVYCHGKKGKALVYVGAVDAPVTISEIDQAIDECTQLKRNDLHVLGWEWEMGLAGPNNDVRRGGLMHDIARTRGVKLSLLQIPREVMEQQAVDNGDIQFFELAYLEAEIEKPNKSTVKVVLEDFIIPNTSLIPNDVRDKIEGWSDYIDYWAVDWDFRNDTFIHGWVTYRTRKDRTLDLVSDTHTYEGPGSYRILVKVIDIFGNDTSQAYDIEVS